MDRQPGYYWVKINNDWEIAEWSSCWERIGYKATYDDSDMEEIDENRIERQTPAQAVEKLGDAIRRIKTP
jgi:hypothetical protein